MLHLIWKLTILGVHQKDAEKWNVTLINTGDNTMTEEDSKESKTICDKNEDFLFYLW